jgi:hypothetical protein
VESRAVQTSVEYGLSTSLFPKTQACQTSMLHHIQDATAEINDVQDSKKDNKDTGTSDNGGGVLTWMRNLVGVTLLVVLIFTACGGLEYDGRIYYPITYMPFRFLDWVPTPRVTMQYVRHPLIW